MRNLFATRLGLALLGTTLVVGTSGSARAVLIESFETGADGWFVPAGTNGTNYEIKGTSATGATDGLSSLVIGPTAANTGNGPNYGQMLDSPSSLTNTALLAAASSLMFDVTVPAADFGYFLQFDCDINNSATGYISLQGYSYPGATIGGTKTFTAPITPAIAAQLATSGTPTTIIIQTGGGFTAGGTNTFYIDNFRTVVAPEPATASVVAAASMLLARRRRA